MKKVLTPLEKRLWNKVRKTKGCWEWTGSTSGGYGRMSLGRQSAGYGTVTRIVWEMKNGPIPEGLHVCHHCDNKVCVRPSHLFVGTRGDNMKDAFNKGIIKPPKFIGSANFASKLTEKQVYKIKTEYQGRYGQKKAMAERYGVNLSIIYKIIRGQLWSHVLVPTKTSVPIRRAIRAKKLSHVSGR